MNNACPLNLAGECFQFCMAFLQQLANALRVNLVLAFFINQMILLHVHFYVSLQMIAVHVIC